MQFDIFKQFVNKDTMMQMCRECNMHTSNNLSDITVGDFWGFKKESMPNGFSPALGTNIVRLNTWKGNDMFKLVENELNVLEL
jgi:Coenzyme F420 hydrogenase/dehydrogenase, beta subunit C terminus.